MSDGHTGPDDEQQEGHNAPEQTNTQEPQAEKSAAEEPVAEQPPGEPAATDKPAPKKRAPRKPKPPAEASAEKPEAEKPAPKRPAQRAAEPPPPPPEEEEKRSVLREPVVMWSVIGGAIVILAALGYVGWTKFGPHHTADTAANALANRSICEATLDRVQDYGVLSPGATLTQKDPDKTQVNGRVTCHAQAGTMQYAMTVDVPCDDMGKDSCLKLYSVKQADGTALFQRQ